MASKKTKKVETVTEETIDVAVEVTEPEEEKEPIKLTLNNCERLNVRKEPCGEVLGIADKSSTLLEIEKDEKWTKVLFNKKEGYVMTCYVKPL